VTIASVRGCEASSPCLRHVGGAPSGAWSCAARDQGPADRLPRDLPPPPHGELPDARPRRPQADLHARSAIRATSGTSCGPCPGLPPHGHVQHGHPGLERESCSARYDQGCARRTTGRPRSRTPRPGREGPVIAAACTAPLHESAPIRRTRPDWAANYVHMLGFEDRTGDFATRCACTDAALRPRGRQRQRDDRATVNSALSDLYYSVSAAMDGLRAAARAREPGMPGLDLETIERFHGAPTTEQLADYARETLERAAWSRLRARGPARHRPASTPCCVRRRAARHPVVQTSRRVRTWSRTS